MGEFIGKIRIEPAGDGLWRICKSFSYITNKKSRIDIPLGFLFDGASIPRFAWSVIGHPLEQDYLAAACIHDFLYRKQIFTRYKSDVIFRQAMADLRVNWLRRWVMFVAVRIGGWKPWNSYKEN